MTTLSPSTLATIADLEQIARILSQMNPDVAQDLIYALGDGTNPRNAVAQVVGMLVIADSNVGTTPSETEKLHFAQTNEELEEHELGDILAQALKG